MILVAYFVLAFVLFLVVAAALTSPAMKRWEARGARHVEAQTSGRNMLVLGVLLALLALVAVMESLIPDVSNAVQDAQYAVGDAVGAGLLFVAQTPNGSISWGLYLTLLLGAALGLMVGTALVAGRYATMRRTPWTSYLSRSRR